LSIQSVISFHFLKNFPAAFLGIFWHIQGPVLPHPGTSTSPSGDQYLHIRDQSFLIQTNIFTSKSVCSDFIPELLRLVKKVWQTKEIVQHYISELNSLFHENLKFKDRALKCKYLKYHDTNTCCDAITNHYEPETR
jgi:hypothetical protein